MNQLGMGVMINMLCGNKETVETFQAAVSKKITALSLEDNALHFTFQDGSKMRIFDDGQSCCESRYMQTDDDLSDYIGGKLKSAEIRTAPDITDDKEYSDAHEVQFLVVKTTKGNLTMANHNQHNGYYGGFSVVVRPE